MDLNMILTEINFVHAPCVTPTLLLCSHEENNPIPTKLSPGIADDLFKLKTLYSRCLLIMLLQNPCNWANTICSRCYFRSVIIFTALCSSVCRT